MNKKASYKKKLDEYYNSDNQYFINLESNFHKNKNKYFSEFDVSIFKKGYNLEAGCGSGAMAMELASKFRSAKFMGVDISAPGIKHANKVALSKSIDNVEFKQSDLGKLPFSDSTFDNILLFDVLEHIVYPKKIFKEFRRVLKKKGKLVIVSPNLIFSHKTPLSIKIKELFESLLVPFGFFKMNHVDPDTSACACGDAEACLVTNPIKIRYLLKKLRFKVIKGSFLRCIFIVKK